MERAQHEYGVSERHACRLLCFSPWDSAPGAYLQRCGATPRNSPAGVCEEGLMEKTEKLRKFVPVTKGNMLSYGAKYLRVCCHVPLSPKPNEFSNLLGSFPNLLYRFDCLLNFVCGNAYAFLLLRELPPEPRAE